MLTIAGVVQSHENKITVPQRDGQPLPTSCGIAQSSATTGQAIAYDEIS